VLQTGLEEMPAERDTSVRMLEEKPHANSMGFCMQLSAKDKARPQATH